MNSSPFRRSPDDAEVRDIPGYEGLYAVARDGRVWTHRREYRPGSTRPLRIIEAGWRLTRISNGYERVDFVSASGRRSNMAVHRCVALVWVPNPEGKPQVNHLNGDKLDNRAENLEWATGSENSKHAWATGLSTVTPAHRAAFENSRQLGWKAKAKLSPKQRAEIASAYLAGGRSGESLAAEYGVSASPIWRAINSARGRTTAEHKS